MEIDLTIPEFLRRKPIAVNYMVFAATEGWVIADRDGHEHGHYSERRVAQHRANLMNGYSVARSLEMINA
jgi:hypothetical protein